MGGVENVRRLSAGELGHGLGALGHGVLGELTREHEAHSGLDLAGGDGGLLVVAGQLGGLAGDLLEQVINERVHDRHSLGGDTGVGVHLLEHLVDVDLVGLHLLGLALALLGTNSATLDRLLSDSLLGDGLLLGGLRGSHGC